MWIPASTPLNGEGNGNNKDVSKVDKKTMTRPLFI